VSRPGAAERATKETRIAVRVDLDGTGRSEISTGIGFFDHMLELLARHACIDAEIRAEGDLHVDEHHTVEDVGLVLGSALADALGARRGIRRYGFLLPMDESLARVALDLGGRPFVVFEAEFARERVGDLQGLVEAALAQPFGMQRHRHQIIRGGRVGEAFNQQSAQEPARCQLLMELEGLNQPIDRRAIPEGGPAAVE
jgi:imidazoleglycerol phosphate dehydratase HisB